MELFTFIVAVVSLLLTLRYAKKRKASNFMKYAAIARDAKNMAESATEYAAKSKNAAGAAQIALNAANEAVKAATLMSGEKWWFIAKKYVNTINESVELTKKAVTAAQDAASGKDSFDYWRWLKAFERLKELKIRGGVLADFHIAMMYIGDGNYKTGVPMIKALVGNPGKWFKPACCVLSNAYAEGIGVAKDISKANLWNTRGEKEAPSPGVPYYVASLPVSPADKMKILKAAEMTVAFIEK